MKISGDDARPIDPAEFIRNWNRAAIRRTGGVVICPRGQVTDETAEQITLAEEAGHAVKWVTGRIETDESAAAAWQARQESAKSDRSSPRSDAA
jgi:hypothetical protein